MNNTYQSLGQGGNISSHLTKPFNTYLKIQLFHLFVWIGVYIIMVRVFGELDFKNLLRYMLGGLVVGMVWISIYYQLHRMARISRFYSESTVRLIGYLTMLLGLLCYYGESLLSEDQLPVHITLILLLFYKTIRFVARTKFYNVHKEKFNRIAYFLYETSLGFIITVWLVTFVLSLIYFCSLNDFIFSSISSIYPSVIDALYQSSVVALLLMGYTLIRAFIRSAFGYPPFGE